MLRSPCAIQSAERKKCNSVQNCSTVVGPSLHCNITCLVVDKRVPANWSVENTLSCSPIQYVCVLKSSYYRQICSRDDLLYFIFHVVSWTPKEAASDTFPSYYYKNK